MDIETTVIHSFEFDGYTVNVLSLDYAGGGQCYEYQIIKDGRVRMQSDSEYGMRSAAIRDAFGWLTDND